MGSNTLTDLKFIELQVLFLSLELCYLCHVALWKCRINSKNICGKFIYIAKKYFKIDWATSIICIHTHYPPWCFLIISTKSNGMVKYATENDTALRCRCYLFHCCLTRSYPEQNNSFFMKSRIILIDSLDWSFHFWKMLLALGLKFIESFGIVTYILHIIFD